MIRAIQKLKNILKSESPEISHWHFFKELEESLNLIEDLEQIGNNFLGKINEIINIERMGLVIYDKDLGRFKINSFFGLSESDVKKLAYFRNQSLVKWLKINQVYFYIKEQPGVFSYLSEQEQNILTALKIELCFPLLVMNRLNGIMFIGRKKTGENFTKEELSMISSLTPQVGIALENAILYKEQRERFHRMSRADKLATLGELAAGAAHEIRNPLTAIKSTLQYLKTENRTPKETKLLETSLNETERIDEILTALLSFSRPAETKKEKNNLQELIGEVLGLISFRAQKQKIDVIRDFPSSPVFILSDPAQLKQLFLNLFLNSIQAMRDGGNLTIEVSAKKPSETLIAISDTGEGIPEEDSEKIFDPFFTTKKAGTGLGLSICYGIVKSHRGEIEVKSTPGQGTTVLLQFPTV